MIAFDEFKLGLESMEKDITEVKTMALLIKTEFKNSYDLLNQKVDYLEQRVSKLELNQIKNNEYEKEKSQSN